ncbi:MAG: ABC transporter permease [Brevinema sp.]
MFLFTIKNMLRYKMRTFLTMFVIMVSAYTSILSLGFQDGFMNIILDGFINYQTGHIRITTPQYLENERFLATYENITNLSKLQQSLSKIPEIKKIVPRHQFFGFISYQEKSYQVRITALDILENYYGFDRYLQSGSIKNSGMLIGDDLANKVNAQINDKLMLVGSTIDGGIDAVKPTLTSIYHYNMKRMDQKSVFIDMKTGYQLLRIKDSAGEILIYLHDKQNLEKVVIELEKQYPNLAIESYKKQFGSMYSMIELQSLILFIITAFVMFLGSLIIVNSMLASIYERMQEFGMMKTIGFSDKEISYIFLNEGAIYGLIGGSLGFSLGIFNITYLSIHGLDLSKIISNSSLPISSILYPNINQITAWTCYLLIISIPSLVALIPAHHIKKITPLEALNNQA